jgi:hypothetical protein
VDDETASQSVFAHRLGWLAEKENTMKNTIYSWHADYKSAVLEIDPKQLPIRISEARRAIDQRLHRPLLIDSPEHKAIEDARRGLAELEAERVERQGRVSW